MAEKVDIYQLISHHCTSDQIVHFLRHHRQAGATEVQTSGKKEALIQHLKEAVDEKHIYFPAVLEFLRESEENGNQHIFFFFPKYSTHGNPRRADAMSSTLAMVLTAAMAVPGNGPEMVSEEVE
jgi:hypothetical protein